MSDWKKQGREDAMGKFLKLKNDGDEFTVTHLGAPDIKELPSAFKKGTSYNMYEFPVEHNGKEKVFSVPPGQLLNQIMDEDDEESIIGRTFKYKQLGSGKDKTFRIKEVPATRKEHGSFDSVEKEQEEENRQDNEESKVDVENEKFKKAVKARAKKLEKKDDINKGSGESGEPLLMP